MILPGWRLYSRPFHCELFAAQSRCLNFALRYVVVAASIALFCGTSHGYVLEGKSWPGASSVTFQLQLGAPSKSLQDGSTSWNAAVAPVFTMWNQVVHAVHLNSVMNSTTAVSPGDGVNSIVFSSTIFGQTFGSSTLAVTYYSSQGSSMIEADVLFNQAQSFDSYRGALQFGSNSYAIPDIRRVLLHELGHALGLGHPDTAGQHVDAVMNSVISNRETLSSDDIAGAQSMYGAPVGPTPTPAPSRFANISTRMQVGLNDDVLIGGFIITGSQSNKVILRAIGPSLAAYGIAGALANPTLELRNSTGGLVAANDDWGQSGQVNAIAASGLAPTSSLESAIIATLAPGSYTAIVRGVNSATGIGMVEGYELTTGTTRLANISTRGRVSTGDNALIGGFIVQGAASKKVIVRALGPSLGQGPGAIAGVLANPVLELHNSAGTLVASNDDWATGSQAAEISAAGMAPPSPQESALIATLPPGSYTAIVRGANNSSGVGLVELYDLDK